MSPRGRGGAAREQGSLSIEAAVLVPVLFALLALVVAYGRVETARAAVQDAAREAARAASLQRGPAQAAAQAAAVARAALAARGVPCTATRVHVPTSAFAAPLGQPASVTVTVACQAGLADLALPLLPGSVQLSDHFTSPLDPYRVRA